MRDDALRHPSFLGSVLIGWSCDTCERRFSADTDLPSLQVRQRQVLLCPVCRRGLVEERADVTGSFAGALCSAGVYPLRGQAVASLILVAAWTGFWSILGVVNAFPPMQPVAYVIGWGVFLGYLAEVVKRSARGDSEMPPPIDVVGLGSWLMIILRFAFALGWSALPVVIAARAVGGAALAVAAVWALITPAALVTAAYGWPSPLKALQLVVRVPRAYALTTAAVVLYLGGALAVIQLIAEVSLRTSIHRIPILPRLLMCCVAAWALVVAARCVGLLLFHQRHEIGQQDG